MTPDLRDLLTRLHWHLRAVSTLFVAVPTVHRAAHLGPKADGLATEIETVLRRWPAEGDG